MRVIKLQECKLKKSRKLIKIKKKNPVWRKVVQFK